jgi:hypothetical protein
MSLISAGSISLDSTFNKVRKLVVVQDLEDELPMPVRLVSMDFNYAHIAVYGKKVFLRVLSHA